VDVLHNDSDPDGDLNKHSITIVSGPTIGSATLKSDGKIRYQAPTVTSSAQHTSLRYQVCDAAGHCTQATLTIVINPKK
jgi:hypothetical protein